MPYVLESLGVISTSVRHFCVCQYIHCLLVHTSHTSCSPSLWAASLLDWMSMDVYYVSCCCSILCRVFIMSPASTTMALTTTPLVTVVCCYIISSLNSYHDPSLVGVPVTSGQHDVALPQLLTPRYSGAVVGFATVPQQ